MSTKMAENLIELAGIINIPSSIAKYPNVLYT